MTCNELPQAESQKLLYFFEFKSFWPSVEFQAHLPTPLHGKTCQVCLSGDGKMVGGAEALQPRRAIPGAGFRVDFLESGLFPQPLNPKPLRKL